MSSTMPTTRSKPMRPMRRRASSASDRLAAKRITSSSGRTTMPTYSANRPSRPTLTEPARCPPANATASRTSTRTGPRPCCSRGLVQRSRSATCGRQVQQLAVGLVRGDRVREVGRSRRLVGGDDGDELLRGHRRQRVVRALLLADGGHRLGREVLAARRTGAVRRVHQRVVGQRHQLVAQGVVERGTELLGGDADRGEQVRATDVTDEEGVARQDRGGSGALVTGRRREVPHHDRDGLGRVARRRQELQLDLAHRQSLAVVDQPGGEPGCGRVTEDDLGSCRGSELQVARQEVRVEVRLDHVGDGQTRRPGIAHVLIDVAAGIHHCGEAARFVGDQVGRLREALQVVLVDLHGCTSSVRERMSV